MVRGSSLVWPTYACACACGYWLLATLHRVAASLPFSGSLPSLRLQPLPHTVAASATYGCSLLLPTVAASATYGCSLLLPTVAASATYSCSLPHHGCRRPPRRQVREPAAGGSPGVARAAHGGAVALPVGGRGHSAPHAATALTHTHTHTLSLTFTLTPTLPLTLTLTLTAVTAAERPGCTLGVQAVPA